MEALTPELEAQKKVMYEKMSPRRRKFIDRIGYENWDPFQIPNEPMDIRRDDTNRTIEMLVKQFLREQGQVQKVGASYSRGALEVAMGIVNKDERYRAMYDFCVWYNDLLKREGKGQMNWEFK
ncbi:hypothetical protein [Desulfobaculum bizertense]|uniref:Uncharacterized protein n=1 Tax=Desulfobaculum bizertense DSM 18034 TaxID=1121442 RepID=A0A1T4WIU4_9BACT|nr:hypothetical protein [Desulfobaculum bizertense]UIJ37164.1 hypothetical protein LWC08_10520 [Desulfobaculum bizertense]SKA77232.1 hypothetical protein SAMN02745702_02312 [Desulfobaculum bizertense DSM 18034]